MLDGVLMSANPTIIFIGPGMVGGIDAKFPTTNTRHEHGEIGYQKRQTTDQADIDKVFKRIGDIEHGFPPRIVGAFLAGPHLTILLWPWRAPTARPMALILAAQDTGHYFG